MNKDLQKSPEISCKNCYHPISLHKPNCSYSLDDNDGNPCGCEVARYYNTIVSDKHIGWTEMHCSLCGIILGYIDSLVENIYDSTTVCSKCISKTIHPH